MRKNYNKTMQTRITSALLSVLTAAAALVSLCGCDGAFTSFSSYEDAGNYSVGGGSVPADGLTEICVNWYSGSVRIEESDTDKITFSEVSNSDKKTDALGEATKNKELGESLKMRYKADNGRLTIQFCKSDLRVRTGAVRNLKKDLTVYVPKDAGFISVKADIVSCTLNVLGIKAESVDINAVSGDMRLTDCVSDSIKCNTVSGKLDITTDKTLNKADFNSVSGDLMISAQSVGSLSVKSVSADAVLYLSQFDFTLKLSGVDTAFEADGLSFEKTGEKNYKFGDGAGDVTFESVSGKVRMEEK